MSDVLVGRAEELGRVGSILSELSEPRGTALVLRGAAGMGKSALLRSASRVARDRGVRVLSLTEVQAEARIPFAALRQLLAPLIRDEPTASTETILAAASGSAASPTIEPHTAGLAALELLSSAGSDRPICLMVDDVHWIDLQGWEALAFLGRRLADEPLFLLVAVREGQQAADRLAGAGLPEVQVGPLSPDAAAVLLDRVAPDLSPPLRRMVLEEAGGNPLGLIELSATAGRLDPDRSVPTSLPLTARLEQTYSMVVTGLPASTHAALARVLPRDSDRGTWHSAAATVGTNEPLAQRLADLAARAGRNGAIDTELAAWERAAELTGDPHVRVDRLSRPLCCCRTPSPARASTATSAPCCSR